MRRFGGFGCAVLIGCAACAMGVRGVTMESFSEISIGCPSEEVLARMGSPGSIQNKEDGSVEYVYTETISLGGRTLEERQYVILLKEGKVSAKQVKQTSPPGYFFNSYDMQTTQQDQTDHSQESH